MKVSDNHLDRPLFEDFTQESLVRLLIKNNQIIAVQGDIALLQFSKKELLSRPILETVPVLYDVHSLGDGKFEFVQVSDDIYINIFFKYCPEEDIVQVLCKDISEKVSRFTQRQQLRNDLEIAQSLLIRQQKSLHEAYQHQSNFFSGISHEFRTPLTTILGQTERMLAQHQVSGLGAVQNNARYLLNLVNNILDYASMGVSELELRPTVLTISALINELKDIFEFQAEEKSMGLYFENNTNIEAIEVDAMRLTQCLVNLISNGIKYSDSGSVSLILEQNDDDDVLRFRVIDTGFGIKPESLKSIFTPFFREKENQHMVSGAGLGLAITQSIIRQLEGDLKVKSEIGKGSEFWFDIPLKPVNFETTNLLIDDIDLSDKTIVVVEDNPDISDLLHAVLIDQVKALHITELANEGLELARRVKPDLMLMDINLPDAKGNEIARKIRSECSEIRILGLSASIKLGEKPSQFQQDFHLLLPKPFSIDALFSSLYKLNNHK